VVIDGRIIMRQIIRAHSFVSLVVSIVLAHPGITAAQREISPEAVVFQNVRDGIVTVFGDAGHGSGFLIDQKGIVVTNQHVVAKSSYLKVQINDSVCVRANLLVEDEKGDMAVLRIHPYRANDVPVLPLRRDSLDLVYEGEKVLAIGNPLSQTRILTVGVVSKVHEGAIISDVDLNPGSSGGPLLNLDGEVVGITTFSERSSDGGEGISGIIAIPRAFDLIDSASSIADKSELPSPDLLPVMPKEMFPLRALEEAAEVKKIDKKAYALARGSFNVHVYSPPHAYWNETQGARLLAEKRRKREAKGQVAEKDKFDPNSGLKDWFQYLGQYPPVVVVTIIPKIGETSGSAFGNLLGAVIAGAAGFYYSGHHNMEFKGDLKDFALMSGGEVVPEIRRGMDFVPMSFYQGGFGGSVGGTDLARAGLFMYPPDIFAPDSTGWPRLKTYMWSIDRPERPDTLTIPQKTCERIWLDFEPFREQQKWNTLTLEGLQ
jgi:hypothetical protein